MADGRLIGVDPSLTCSGWALFDLRSEKLLGVGRIRSMAASFPMAKRLEDLQNKVSLLLAGLELGKGDVMVCEAQTTMRDPRAAFKVEQVRGLFETLGRTIKMSVPGRLNPRTVQYEMMGLRGKQLKRASVKQTAAMAVKHLYADALEGIGFDRQAIGKASYQDIVDAILIGSLAVTKVKSAGRTGVAFEQFFEERPFRRRQRA
jgi:Holliday junction resolvasome RuvABC endonuclease subunit